MKFVQVIKSTDWKINILALVSVACIFLHDLYWFSLPELFQGGDALMSSLYNILMGYAVSYVFFILVVQYKEYNDSQYINAIVRPVLESMVVNHMEINKALTAGLGVDQFNGLSAKATEELFERLGVTDIVPNIAETFIFRRCSWIEYFDYQRKHILRQLNVLKPFISHLDPELIELLNRYENCKFYLALHFLLKDEEREDNLSIIGGYYSEYSLLGKTLYEYVKKLP